MELYRTFRRSKPLLPIIPQFARQDGRIGSRILSTVRCSPLMRSIISFELDDDCILPVVSNPAIDGTTSRLNNFVNGFDLEKDILSYMRHLRQFNFHIRTIFENATHVEIDTIRQSFMKYQQESVDCAVDFFNNNYGQCQIY
ncbi:unnamed protein product [Rotaria sordida]|uniref:Uncharacterized protein n=1 Tax=Rotaria sordida TaxID=392033 RepID=A0A820FWH2_9BILA|nr:unnamed protein product [Rotaria sordida]